MQKPLLWKKRCHISLSIARGTIGVHASLKGNSSKENVIRLNCGRIVLAMQQVHQYATGTLQKGSVMLRHHIEIYHVAAPLKGLYGPLKLSV